MAGEKVIVLDSTNNIKEAGDITAAWTSSTDTSKVLKPDGSNGVQWAAESGGVFGNEYQSAESTGESSSSAETWQDKLTLTTGTLPSGVYHISFQFDTYLNSGDDLVEGRVYNSTDTAELYYNEHDETEYHNCAGVYKTGTISGVKSFKIQYRRSVASTSGTAYIQWARLAIWRVS